MNRPDKNDPIYALTVSGLLKEFIHHAYFNTGLVRPSIGYNSLAVRISKEAEMGKTDPWDIKELTRLKMNMERAIYHYQKRNKSERIDEIYNKAKTRVPGISSFEDLISLMFDIMEEIE